jgi:hypothetical protein
MRTSLVVVVLVGLALAAILAVRTLKREMRRIEDAKPQPVRYELTVISNKTASATFVAPQGGFFDLVIGTAKPGSLDENGGVISISNSRGEVYRTRFAVSDFKKCNWLGPDLQAFLITEATNSLDPVISVGTEYHLTITLNEAPSDSASLWLSFLQPMKYYRENGLTNRGQLRRMP